MTENEFTTKSVKWDGKLDHRKVKSVRLAVQDQYLYEDPCVKWAVEVQYLSSSDDPKSDIPEQWWNWLTIVKFRHLDWAIEYAKTLPGYKLFQFIHTHNDS